MPGFNRQGPGGSGSMTGRAMGMCRRTQDLPEPGTLGAGQGRGMGGRGLGNRCRTAPVQRAQRPQASSPSPQVKAAESQDLQALKKEYQEASSTLDRLAAQIEALEAKQG